MPKQLINFGRKFSYLQIVNYSQVVREKIFFVLSNKYLNYLVHSGNKVPGRDFVLKGVVSY